MTYLKLKANVELTRFDIRILLAIQLVYSVYSRYGYDCIITSISDGIHSAGSLHYEGLAADFRIRHLPSRAIAEIIFEDIRNHLTDDYDVVLESDHIHVEYDRKAAPTGVL